jgi:general secretion pathway protein D
MKTMQSKMMMRWICVALCCLGAAAPTYSQIPVRSYGAGAGGSGGSRPYIPNGNIGDAVISCDPDTKQITVIADEETLKHVGQLIGELDAAHPQALIKVVFLEVTHNDSSDIGIEGSVTKKLGASSIVGSFSNVFGLASAGAIPVPPGAGLYSVLGRDFQATIRAIASAGKTEILSRPSILVRNNQQATINLGKQVPLITNTRFDTLGNQINSVTYHNTGIILQVTPFITLESGSVEMIVSPQISELADRTEWIPISTANGGVSAPVINSRTADTVVVAPDGQTVIIGGLMQNSKSSSDSKIPLLGDIPLLGALFRRKVKSDVKTELIIFLTPHIIQQPKLLASVASKERANSEVLQKAFTEQELDRFLDTLPVKGESSNKRPAKNNTPTAPSPDAKKQQ